jgi:hypothetical protein
MKMYIGPVSKVYKLDFEKDQVIKLLQEYISSSPEIKGEVHQNGRIVLESEKKFYWSFPRSAQFYIEGEISVQSGKTEINFKTSVDYFSEGIILIILTITLAMLIVYILGFWPITDFNGYNPLVIFSFFLMYNAIFFILISRNKTKGIALIKDFANMINTATNTV